MSEDKAPPDSLALRAKPRPVTRLNRRTLALLGGVAACAVLGATIWAFQSQRMRPNANGPELYNVDRVTRAEGLDALPHDYTGLAKPPQLGAPMGELNRPVVQQEQQAGLPPMPAQPAYQPNPEEDAERAERLRLQREAEDAARAQVFFQISQHADKLSNASAAAEPSRQDLSAIPAAAAAAPAVDEGSAQNMQTAKQAFVDKAADQQIYGTGHLQTPRSAYQVMAGTIIPAALVTGINSDLPGQIIATVTENVYDTATGHFLLIPQGTRLLGQYDSQVAYDQSRVLLVWNRLIMPDGSSITLDRQPGVDTAGYAGLEDQVDWHWGRLLAGAALSTLLGVGAELAQPDNDYQNGGVTIAVRQSTQDSVNQVGQQITRRNLNVQPTLTIRPGFPVRVIVDRDLVFQPYGTPSASR